MNMSKTNTLKPNLYTASLPDEQMLLPCTSVGFLVKTNISDLWLNEALHRAASFDNKSRAISKMIKSQLILQQKDIIASHVHHVLPAKKQLLQCYRKKKHESWSPCWIFSVRWGPPQAFFVVCTDATKGKTAEIDTFKSRMGVLKRIILSANGYENTHLTTRKCHGMKRKKTSRSCALLCAMMTKTKHWDQPS